MPESTVAAFTDLGEGKYALLEKALEESGFWQTLEEHRARSGKSGQDFKIAIKPNLSMMLRRADVGTYTDPFLLVHFLRLLALRGFTRLFVVESQNLYGNWFRNHSVVQVGARLGLVDASLLASGADMAQADIRVRGGGVNLTVPLVDLTLDQAPHDFGLPIGTVMLGKTWMDADFRISFAKFKTHFYGYYTLAIKNVYGCLPAQDKVSEYHAKRTVGLWTAWMIRDFPVHFSVVDAYTGADGWLGVKIKAICAKPRTIIAGADILAVDRTGARLMGLDHNKSSLYRNLAALLPEKPFALKGNAGPVAGWRNTLYLFVRFSQIIESWANIMDYAGALSTGGFDPCFVHKKSSKGAFKALLYLLTFPVNCLVDMGIVRLRLREKIFFARARLHGRQAPFWAGSDFLLSRLTFFSHEDVRALAEMLASGFLDKAEHSGHYVFCQGREMVFPARLSTANMALMEICGHLEQNRQDPRRLAAELLALEAAAPGLFGKPGAFAFCYA